MGWEKVACWSIKAAISLKRVKTEEKLSWRAYWESQKLSGHSYKAHRAVIFAIAQISCLHKTNIVTRFSSLSMSNHTQQKFRLGTGG